MNKLLPIILVSILTLGGFGACALSFDENNHIINETIYLSDLEFITDINYVTINLPEKTTFTWETSKPMLPVHTKTYTFPFGTKIDNVDVKFSDAIEKKLSLPIKPVHRSQIRSIYVSH